MIEEIKKEIELLLVLDDVLYCKDCGSRNIKKSYKPYKIAESIMKILDKYKKQEMFLNERIDTLKDTQLKQLNKISELEKYKNAWEELKEYQIDLDKTNMDTLVRDNSEFYHYQRGNMMGHKNIGLKIQELEKKHEIEVE